MAKQCDTVAAISHAASCTSAWAGSLFAANDWWIGVPMPPPTEQIKCPREPAHGLANKRWLAPKERQMITRGNGDVFEIDCRFCGKYEIRLDISELNVAADLSDDDQNDFW